MCSDEMSSVPEMKSPMFDLTETMISLVLPITTSDCYFSLWDWVAPVTASVQRCDQIFLLLPSFSGIGMCRLFDSPAQVDKI